MKSKRVKNDNDILNLIKSDKLFDFILSNIRIEVLIINSSGVIVYANAPAVKALGYSKNDVIGNNITKFIRPKISKKVWHNTHFAELKKKKKLTPYVIERVVRDGSLHSIEISAGYFKYKGKEYILSSSKNITEKKRLEAKLAESETLFRFFTEQAADGIFTVDLNGRVLYANKASEEITKVPFAAARGRHFTSFISDRSRAYARKVFNKVKKGESVILGEMEILDKDGKKIPVEFTSSPIFKEGKIFQLHTMFRDITSKKEFDALLRQSEKNDAIRHFIAGTSQEIQSPLKGLLENTESLISNYKHRDYEYVGFKEFMDIIKTLEHMRDQLKYCCDTSSRLLSISKRRVGLKINNCDVNVVVRNVLRNLDPTIDMADIKVNLKTSKNLPLIAMGSVEFNQVVTNILTNSIQAIFNKGIIDIKVSFLKDENVVLVIVRDNGVGIPKDILPKVCDPFFTTKSRGLEKNSGLGLSIAYSIIKSVKGDILIDSSARQGAKVQLKIPVYKNDHK